MISICPLRIACLNDTHERVDFFFTPRSFLDARLRWFLVCSAIHISTGITSCHISTVARFANTTGAPMEMFGLGAPIRL